MGIIKLIIPILIILNVHGVVYLYECEKVFDIRETERVLRARLTKIAYPDVPSVEELSIVNIVDPSSRPQKLILKTQLSPGVADPLLARVRELKVVDDFKPLSDLKRVEMSAQQLAALKKRALKAADGAKSALEHEKAYLRYMLKHGYDDSPDLVVVEGVARPLWKINSGNADMDAAFDYTEDYLDKIIRRTPIKSKGSMLSMPYEGVAPNHNRFDELYYWDTYFGAQGLIETGRLDLAMKQAENFLSFIRRYGMVPNGSRDYYLGRSQPPFVASLIFDIYQAAKKKYADSPEVLARLKDWMRRRAFPLLEKDLNSFWMNPAGRFDAATGLHHHWDDLNLVRPERSAHDIEVKRFEGDEHALGEEPRDARATAESGLDFSAELDQRGSQVANVLLNSVLYQYMSHMSDFAREIGASRTVVSKYLGMAKAKKEAINKYLWNNERGVYQNYHLEKKSQVPVVSASTMVPLYVGVASPKQAARVVGVTLDHSSGRAGILEVPFGLGASDAKTIHQWDDTNIWAPNQYMAWEGLRRYGHTSEADRLVRKYVDVVTRVHKKDGVFMERYDGIRGSRPREDGDKYTTQEGFLWTNSVFVVAIRRYLGLSLVGR